MSNYPFLLLSPINRKRISQIKKSLLISPENRVDERVDGEVDDRRDGVIIEPAVW